MIRFKKINFEKKFLYLVIKIRNEKSSRLMSVDKKLISKKIHYSWFLNNIKKEIYLIKCQKKIVGYIRIILKKKYELSWAIAEKYRGKNLGYLSLKLFLKKNPSNKYICLIKKNNIPSLIMAIKNNFIFMKRKKNIIFLQIE